MSVTKFGSLSKRICDTSESVIKQSAPFWHPNIHNLAQGMVYWQPPTDLLQKIDITPLDIHRYGPIEGHSSLIELLQTKIKNQNNLTNREIMVTAGSNQGFISVVLALCDPGDEVILFAPYFFNHMMALQMANVKAVVIPPNSDFSANIDAIQFTEKTKMVVLVSPANPSGAITPPDVIKKLQQKCHDAGVWLVSDEAYEYFIYDENTKHYSPDGENVINLFTFSKSHAMAGWRVGYIAYPEHIKDGLDKAQDVIPINVAQASQRVAIESLKYGDDWIKKHVQNLGKLQREVIWNAIRDFEGTIKSPGGFYYLVKLPPNIEEMEAVAFLAQQYGIFVVPCSNCGLPGYIRIAYGALKAEIVESAAAKLREGLIALKDKSNAKQ